jgi:hypothetical protein
LNFSFFFLGTAMADFYDALESRDPAAREKELFSVKFELYGF